MTSSGKQVQDRSNFNTRLMTAVIGGPLILIITYIGSYPFLILGLVMAVLSVLEFCALGTDRSIPGNLFVAVPASVLIVLTVINHQLALTVLIVFAVALLTVVLDTLQGVRDHRIGRIAMTLAAVLYSALPPAFLIQIRALPDGLLWLLLIFALTWGTDTLAYMGGRLWGKRPLAPKISPKKTVEGAVVGVIGGFVLGLITIIAGQKTTPALIIVICIAPPLAVVGDLFESMLKRYFHVGDSHLRGFNIIPGHGGVLDRTDALIWVTTLLYIYFVLSGTTI